MQLELLTKLLRHIDRNDIEKVAISDEPERFYRIVRCELHVAT